jgi:thiol-disulfide isomerase/thioredoxin
MKKVLILILLAFHIAGYCDTSQPVLISGSCDQLKNGDSVTLSIYKIPTLNDEPDLRQIVQSRIKDGKFYFKFSANSYPTYITVSFNLSQSNLIVYKYLVENGDNIMIRAVGDSIYYSGKGSYKWILKKKLEYIGVTYLRKLRYDIDNYKDYLVKIDSSAYLQLSLLKAGKANLSDKTFSILKADIIGHLYLKYFFISEKLKDGSNVDAYLKIDADYVSAVSLHDDTAHFVKTKWIERSVLYPNSIIDKYRYDSCTKLQRPFIVKDCYTFIKRSFHGLLRERLITTLLFNSKNDGKVDLADFMRDALGIVNDPQFRPILLKLKSNMTSGALAYNFSLPDVNGKKRTLKEFNGSVILMDFWYTGCGNCANLSPYINKIEELYQGKNVVFISVSMDKKRAVWLKSVEEGKYCSKESVNLYTNGNGYEDPIIVHYNVSGAPTLILIDKKGKICRAPMDARKDEGVSLTHQIAEELSK